MHADYVQKVNSVIADGREGLAHELAQTFAEESAGAFATAGHVEPARDRRAAGRRAPSRGRSGRPPGQPGTRLGRMGRLTRSTLDRFDRYTLDVFNPASPYGRPAERPDRSA
jgi:hypothetical protein